MRSTNIKGNFRNILTIAVLIGVGVLLFWGWFGTTIKAGDEMLEINGLHAQDVAYKDIESVALHNELPTITAKTGGFSLAGKRLGNFATTEYGVVKLYLHNNEKPFIVIEKSDGKMLIMNCKEPGDTRDLYQELTDKYMGDIL